MGILHFQSTDKCFGLTRVFPMATIDTEKDYWLFYEVPELRGVSVEVYIINGKNTKQ